MSKSTSTRPPGKCIFCERPGNLSKEHLFPDWLGAYFPRNSQTRRNAKYTRWKDEAVVHLPEERAKTEHGHPGTKKFRKVCEDCNNQWMSRIEDQAKPALARLTLGTTGHLTREAQTILSTWATKTVMVAEHLLPNDSGIQQSERTALMSTQLPPDNWFVWIAGYEGKKWRDLGIGQVRIYLDPEPVSKPSEARYQAQATTFGLGNIIFCVINTTSPDAAKYYSGREDSALVSGLLQIWPGYHRTILWPPMHLLGDEEADNVSNIFKHSAFLDPRSDPGANWQFSLPS